MRTSIVTFLIIASTLESAYGQRLASQELSNDSTVIGEVEDAMIRFGEKRRAIPKPTAYLCRGVSFGMKNNGSGNRTSDYCILAAEDINRSDSSFYAHGLTILEDPDESQLGVTRWEMILTDKGRTCRRNGADNRRDLKFLPDADGKFPESEMPPLRYPLDLFMFSICDYGSFAAGKNLENVVWDVFLGEGREVVLAAKTAERLTGVWRLKGRLVKVEFDVKNDLMPVRVEWRAVQKDGDPIELLRSVRVYSETHTRWVKIRARDQDCYVPVHFKCISPGPSKKSMLKEVELLALWEFPEKIGDLVPSIDDVSWTSKFFVASGIEKSFSFEEFKAFVQERHYPSLKE